MRYSKKILSMNLFLAFVFVLLIALPSISFARADNHWSNNKQIVVKDEKTNTVIYQNDNSYYYGFLAPTSSAIISRGEINPNEIIIKYKNQKDTITIQNINNTIFNTIRKYGLKTRQINGYPGLALLRMNQSKDYFAVLHELNRNSLIEYAEPNYIAHIAQTPNDPYYSRQWGPQDIHADLAWDKVDLTKRAAITIAILDTGINTSHEDLQGSIVPGYNFINNNTNPLDGNGHGSHVAGIAAAISNNGKGIAGIAGGVKIMPVKVMDDNGSGSYSNIINGIKYAADHGANVISMSLGGPGASQSMQEAVNYAISRGVAVVAASGNNNGAVSFPGNCNGVITVGAVDNNNQRASFSNYGPEMDVTAPGVNIISSYKGGASSYTSMSGTSMATPFVAGVAALVKAANPSLSSTEVTNIIDKSATDLGTTGFDNYYGYGLVDANKAVVTALNGQNDDPAPQPTPDPQPVPTPVPTPVPSPSKNLALHKPAVASSIEGYTRTADKAVDGNNSTRWASQPGIDPQYIYVDLGKISQINKIILNWEKAYAKSYQIYVSNDGRNWSNLFTTYNGTGGINTINLSGQGRYVLIYGLQRGTPYGYSLWEFEVYGNQ